MKYSNLGKPIKPRRRLYLLLPTIRYGLCIVSFLAICGALIAGYFFAVGLIEAISSANWPKADGVVTYAGIEQTRGSRGQVSYAARIGYQYRVDNRSYTGWQVSKYDMGYPSQSSVQEIVDRYALNTRHSVYYDPNDPTRAVLEPGLAWRSFVYLLLPIGALAFGIGAFKGSRALKRMIDIETTGIIPAER